MGSRAHAAQHANGWTTFKMTEKNAFACLQVPVLFLVARGSFYRQGAPKLADLVHQLAT
jgi:hypothetical protein